MSDRRSYGTGSLWSRIDKNGAETWYGKWIADGHQVKRKIGPKRAQGTSDGLTRAQAERQLRELIAGHASQPQLKERLTVRDATERFLAVKAAKVKPTTLGTYRSLLDTHILPSLGNKPLAKVTTGDVDRLILSMSKTGKSPKLIRNAVSALHGVYAFAGDSKRGWAAANPCVGVDLPRLERTRQIRFLTVEELHAVISAVPANTVCGPTLRVAYLTAALTGLRLGEIRALCWGDINWAASSIYVTRNLVRGTLQSPKGNRGRSVPMADEVAAELERHHQHSHYQADDNLVFCHPHAGTALNDSNLLDSLARACAAAGVRRVRFHELRHTFGTTLAAAGVPTLELQEWMGHADAATTSIYLHYAPKRDAAARINAAFQPSPVSDRVESAIR